MTRDNTQPKTNEATVSEIKQRIIRLSLDQRNNKSFTREVHSICRQLDAVDNPRTAIRLILAFFDVKCRPSCCPDKASPCVVYWSHVQKRFGELIASCEESDSHWIIDQLVEIVDRQNLEFVPIFEHCNQFLPAHIMEGLGTALMKRYFQTEFARTPHDVVVSVMVSRLAENLNDVEMFYATSRYGQNGRLQILDYTDLLAIFGRREDLEGAMRAAAAVVEHFVKVNPANVIFLAATLKEDHPLISIFVRQELVKHLIEIGTKQALHTAANELVTLDEDAAQITDWLLIKPHEEFMNEMRKEHGTCDILWDSYKGGINTNFNGYTLNVVI